ncbi:MAG: hypothetical protein FD163_1734 [Hyphomonadaceae bacterium]|nr:MAG: hypothetical protein FD128_401 [Hyphomonadaceae bacterium]KAF0185037.1 MAG: hypothetical protein FD163_1734 [Hyphomonadaceae bacterium]
MTVSVAEYLGICTDCATEIIPIKIRKDESLGVQFKPELQCPFKNSHCDKAKRGDKPVCSVRDSVTGVVWIVCEHRLCATSPKHSKLTSHQKDILQQVAMCVFDNNINASDIIVKREVSMKVTEASNYKADYVMWRLNPNLNSLANSDKPIVLEMQGGGETTNTGALSKHITAWEENSKIDNNMLRTPIQSVGTLETNAWRRQQEQFLVKGNIAVMTGGRIVFCVGRLLYDYLMLRFINNIPRDLRTTNWSLSIIAFDEDKEKPVNKDGSIRFSIDPSRVIFTNYNSFVQVLTNQAKPSETLFTGKYMDFEGNIVDLY